MFSGRYIAFKPPHFVRVLTVMASLLASCVARADQVNLGTCLGPVARAYAETGRHHEDENCDRLIRGLRQGDRVTFSDGRTFRLGRPLSRKAFGNTVLWTDADDPSRVLRIPNGTLQVWSMGAFLKGYGELADTGVPMVKILDPENDSLEYQLVERLFIKIEFQNIVNYFKRSKKIPAEIRGIPYDKLRSSLADFARAAYRIEYLTDGIQAGFDGEKWILFDLTTGNGTLNAGLMKNGELSTHSMWWEYELEVPFAKDLDSATLIERLRAQVCIEALGGR